MTLGYDHEKQFSSYSLACSLASRKHVPKPIILEVETDEKLQEKLYLLFVEGYQNFHGNV